MFSALKAKIASEVAGDKKCPKSVIMGFIAFLLIIGALMPEQKSAPQSPQTEMSSQRKEWFKKMNECEAVYAAWTTVYERERGDLFPGPNPFSSKGRDLCHRKYGSPPP
jgi:hypothetical protein